MDGVLNTTTDTVHKRGSLNAVSDTACGATLYVAEERLDSVDVEQAVRDRQASKCGRCFEDGSGY